MITSTTLATMVNLAHKGKNERSLTRSDLEIVTEWLRNPPPAVLRLMGRA